MLDLIVNLQNYNNIFVIVYFLAEGFSEPTAKLLGEKITVWFELASGSWGLRAMKACLEAAGRRLHSYPGLVFVSEMARKEMELFVDTLRQQIKSKLVDEDVPKFDALLEAAFGRDYGGRKNSKVGNADLEMDHFYQAILKAIKELNLVESEVSYSFC